MEASPNGLPRKRAVLSGTLLTLLTILCSLGNVLSQAPEPSSPPVEALSPEEKAQAAIDSSLNSLRALSDSINTKEEEISALETAIEEAENETKREPLVEKSRQLQQELLELEAQFETIAGAGVDVTRFEEPKPEPVDLQSELVKLLQPLIDEAKEATETPREIEKLRGDLAKYRERKQLAETAVAELNTLAAANEDAQLEERLSGVRQVWESRLQQAENQITVTNHQLETKSGNQQPFIDTARQMALRFFRSRGANLLWGVGAFVIVYALLRFFYRQLHRIALFRAGGRTFGGRLLDVLFQIAIFIAALLAMIVSFYLAHDLMLLGLTLLFLAGLSWGGIRFLPGYLEQVRLLLNLGPVREGERLVFDGLPWKLERLNFQCVLTNPSLGGGILRLPVKALIGQYSRPLVPEESWFPCAEKDWVRLQDGTCAEVVWQTMEMVRLEPLGKAALTYQTQAFLDENPQVLSNGFRISTIFGLDYRHQAESTGAIPQQMAHSLQEGLSQLIDPTWIRNIEVELVEASSSAINYEIDVDVAGDAAPSYERLERSLTRILLETCNTHQWSIPLTQIRLHQS